MSSLARTALLAAAAVTFGIVSLGSTTDAAASPIFLPKKHWHKHHHHPHWHGHWRRRVIYAAPVVVSAPPVYRPAPARAAPKPEPKPEPKPDLSACLTKEYAPEGLVVFKDKCTNEIATAPVPGVPQQQSAAPAAQNFAGRTFKDFQASQPNAAGQPAPSTEQK